VSVLVAAPDRPAEAPEAVTAWPVAAGRSMMGGRVSVHVIDDADDTATRMAADRVLGRIERWAARLTRFDPWSELSRLNDAPGREIAIGPTLTTALDWARTAESLSDGLVNAAMLDARLAAERGDDVSPPGAASRRWSLRRRARGSLVVREPGLRFDLDGVAKGWLADRALAVAPGRSALIDGDGDIAIRLAPGDAWTIGIADPRDPDRLLATVRLAGPGDARTWGLATSGTSVHRWSLPGGVAHHLIDPRTWRPATTDVIQATVLAATARAAEALAKVAVIVGADEAFVRLDRPDVHGLLVLTEGGEVRASRGMVRWLA
jgi:thiamine biosynthesis lipoprotein